MGKKISVGDWAQVTKPEGITEPGFMGERRFVHGKRNALCHVMSDAGDGWFDAFFERTGTISIVHESEIKKLCGPDGSDVGAR
jgi:hypothetical protein